VYEHLSTSFIYVRAKNKVSALIEDVLHFATVLQTKNCPEQNRRKDAYAQLRKVRVITVNRTKPLNKYPHTCNLKRTIKEKRSRRMYLWLGESE